MLTTWLSNAAGEIDLSETSIAAIWKIRPFIGGGYLDRAAPDFAPAKFRVFAFSTGPLIELDCGSNCPGRIVGPGRSAAVWRFLIFCAALAFARWRDLALVMGSVPFRVAGGSLAVSWPDVLITKIAGETDLHERRNAAPRQVRPFIGGRLSSGTARVTIVTDTRQQLGVALS